jgi:hypothetical protein
MSKSGMIATRLIRRLHKLRLPMLISLIFFIYWLLTGWSNQRSRKPQDKSLSEDGRLDNKTHGQELGPEQRIQHQEDVMKQVIKEAQANLQMEAPSQLPPSPPPEKPEYKCRHRSSKYSDAYLADLTPRLAKTLQRYVRLHDSQLRNFTAEQAAIAPMTWANNTSRFVLWAPPADDSNVYQQLSGLLSVFLLAVLTDRAIVVPRSRADFEHGFCAPLKGSWYVDDESVAALIKTAEAASTIKQRIPLKAAIIRDRKTDLMCAGNFRERYEHIQWLILQDNVSLLPWMRGNRAYDQAWNTELFPEGLVFRPLANYWLHPKNDLWDALRAIQTEYAQYDARVGYYANNDIQLQTIAKIVSGLGKRVMTYAFSGDAALDSSLSAVHLVPDIDQWQAASLDLQLARYLDAVYLPASQLNSSDPRSLIFLHAVRHKDTFVYDQEDNVRPLAFSDHYALQIDNEC